MNFRSLIALLAVICVLMVTISPLTARNTPYPFKSAETEAHPWQDDDQYTEPLNLIRVILPVGPFVVSVDLPLKWFGDKKPNVNNIKSDCDLNVKTSKPMSLNQKGDTR